MKRRISLVGLLLAAGILLFGMLASRQIVRDTHSIVSASPTHHGKPNRLAGEKSPYLLQHAYNPVDWYPWGAEAFEKARREDKPIFLSIGYSTCHWCHVMERESFENPEIAKVMNDYFVCIKVDREERPDLDQIYMTATQAMTGSGGWPMSVWLNHKLQPFYTGTYFPPENRYGRPGFPEILKRIHEVWTENRDKINAQGASLQDALKQHAEAKGDGAAVPASVIAEAYSYFQKTFDATTGGFGGAPKFPRAVQFPFLFRHYAATGERHSLDMALFTMQHMARGGMYDQLGGGFARYSVDAEWRVPHFEKMLYDNAQLLSAYTEAWQITQEDFYRDVARDIVRYVARDMTAPGGAFFSAEDADSEGEEGTFYVWTEEETRALLGEDVAKVVMRRYDFHPGGNFEHGKNVLHAVVSMAETAKRTGKTVEQVSSILEAAKQKMFDVRCKRPRPHLDDKILTGWNGLMISGLAQAGRAFGEKEFTVRAEKAADFILKTMRDPKTGRLLRRYRDGEAKGEAFLDDYTFFTAGLLDLFAATQDPRWLGEAIRITDEQVSRLWDAKHGGFYFAGAEDESLLVRPKSDYEGAEPAGNSVAALNLLRLAQLTDKAEYRDRAEKTIRAFSGNLRQHAASMPLLLCALLDSRGKGRQIVIAGEDGRADTEAMWCEASRHYLPNTILLLADGGKRQAETAKLVSFLAAMKQVNGKATAYVCEDFACKAPTTELEAFRKSLGK